MKLTGFQGRTALVTGAAGGIGQAVVAALRDAGANVLACDMPDALTAAGVTDDAQAHWQGLDVRDPQAVQAGVDLAERRFGPLSLVVHAAGVLATTPILSMPPDEWQRLIDINLGGTFHVLKSAGAVMAARGQGAIVVISSNAAGVPRMDMGAYAASKAAATMLARCVGLELAGHGVRCNIVAPGSTRTGMLTGMWQDDSGADAVIAGNPARFRTGIPLGKLAAPEDIAAAAIYLLSDQAGHVTMTDLYVDGGATLRA